MTRSSRSMWMLRILLIDASDSPAMQLKSIEIPYHHVNSDSYSCHILTPVERAGEATSDVVASRILTRRLHREHRLLGFEAALLVALAIGRQHLLQLRLIDRRIFDGGGAEGD